MRKEKEKAPHTDNGLLATAFILIILTATVSAKEFKINIPGGALKIPLGNTVVKKLENIPGGIPGLLKLRMKWHAVNSSSDFNALRIRLIHGNRILLSSNCYSIHSNRTPKCQINLRVNEKEAATAEIWKLEITNNSKYEVRDFDIEKGNDANILIPDFTSIFEANCPGEIKLDMEGTTLTLQNGNTQFRKIYRIGNSQGVLKLKAKWHVAGTKDEFNKLRIELLKPNGQVARSGEYFSIHAEKKFPRFDISYKISAADAAMPGAWKLRITNNSKSEIKGFNIERESSETDPSVPAFHSTFKSNCSP